MILNLTALETILSNSCFLVLLLTTIYYWIKIIFYSNSNYNAIGLIGNIIANIILTVELTFRWIESGHFPLSNLYESLLFLSWSLLTFYIFIEKKTQFDFLGVIISPAILCLVAFSGLSLPLELQESRPLVPALQSNWLFMHVTVMMLSYAGLLFGCFLAILYLVFYFYLQFFKVQPLSLDNKSTLPFQYLLEITSTNLNVENGKILEKNKSNFLEFLDSFSYRTIGIGFCFLTLGILSGAVWANETWGNYWSWDPKETWALITWLTFATYLHTRLIRAWEGLKPAYIASFGFITIWICYLGVNLLGKGLHSYGFLTL